LLLTRSFAGQDAQQTHTDRRIIPPLRHLQPGA
jgi:hypothetical protein